MPKHTASVKLQHIQVQLFKVVVIKVWSDNPFGLARHGKRGGGGFARWSSCYKLEGDNIMY